MLLGECIKLIAALDCGFAQFLYRDDEDAAILATLDPPFAVHEPDALVHAVLVRPPEGFVAISLVLLDQRSTPRCGLGVVLIRCGLCGLHLSSVLALGELLSHPDKLGAAELKLTLQLVAKCAGSSARSGTRNLQQRQPVRSVHLADCLKRLRGAGALDHR